MNNILITGGCGFIGSNFIKYMVKKYPKYEITNYDKLTYAGNRKNILECEYYVQTFLIYQHNLISNEEDIHYTLIFGYMIFYP